MTVSHSWVSRDRSFLPWQGLAEPPWLGFNYTIEKANKLKEEQGSVNSFFNDSEDQACFFPLAEASLGIWAAWVFRQASAVR